MLFRRSSMRRRRAQSHKISQDIAKATIGTHARSSAYTRRRQVQQRPAHSNLGLGGFEGKTQQSTYANQKHTRHIDHVLDVEGRARKTNAQAQRKSQASSIRARNRSFTYKKILLLASFAVLCIGLVGFIATAAFFGSLSSRMSLDDEQTQALLSPVQRDAKLEYILIEGTSEATSQEPDQADMLLLLALNREEKKASSFIIPANMQVKDKQGQDCAIKDLYTPQTSVSVVERINKKLGIAVNHLIRLNKPSFVGFIESIKGVTCTFPEEIDDPYAGREYISQGEHTLTGEEAYVALRARNYKDPADTQAAMQGIVLKAIFEKLKAEPLQSLPGLLESLSGVIKSDLTPEDLLRLIDFAKQLENNPQVYIIPGSFYLGSDGAQSFAFNSKSWEKMLDEGLVSEQETPDQTKSSSGGSARTLSNEERARIEETAKLSTTGKLSITLRNGSGIDGAAGEVESRLSEYGFKLKNMGNADSFVYDDTMVVYKDEAHKDDVQALVDALGFGRITDQSVFYSFKSDILVVVGKDFKPR